jgi:xanthine dehydrogenase accessory factor
MNRQLLEILMQKIEAEDPVALVTVVDSRGSSPGKAGFKMLVDDTGAFMGTVGGGLLEATLINDAMAAIAANVPQLKTYTLDRDAAGGLGMICGGEITAFIDVIAPPDTLVLVGAGHISQPLAAMAKTAGFRVLVLDDREDFCNPERFPTADRCLVGGFSALLENLKIKRNSYIAIVSRGHSFDQLALEKTIRSGAAYVGMIGSRNKVETVFRNMKEIGFTAAELERIHAPIGLQIGAQTPEEIAVSILAEMIAVKNKSR